MSALPGMEEYIGEEGQTARPRSEKARARSEEARALFEVKFGEAPWMEDYWELLAEGWPWRQVVYMVWASLPRDLREPKTQQKLATEMLGLTSDRVIRTWRERNPALDVRVGTLTRSMLLKARSDIIAALIESASNPNARSHPDRKMALEMTGDYVQRQVIVQKGLGTDLSAMGEDELAARACLPPGGGEDGDGVWRGR